jgi:nitric oxide synthase oxygenase domain/subunit
MSSGPINAKSFMEFFEKEYGVKFVDHKTGRSALEIINEREKEARSKRVCGNCICLKEQYD